MPPKLENLPTELLLDISDMLDSSHPPSLLAFAKTSTRFYDIASKFLFQTIKFYLSGPGHATRDGHQLVQVVQTWEELLGRNGSFRHVRRLILFGLHRPIIDPPDSERMPSNTYLSLKTCERNEDDSELQSCWDLYSRPCWSWTDADAADWDDEYWRLFCHFVTQLQGLTDIYYACSAPIPNYLLQLLEVSHCRLHHYTYHQHSRVTAPCIYSIGSLSRWPPHQGALRTLVRHRHQVPGLKRVYVRFRSEMREILHNHDNDHGEFDRIDDRNNDRDDPAPLESLQVDGWSVQPPAMSFSVVSRETLGDFSALRVLKLNVAVKPHLPAPDKFPSLVTLTFTCITTRVGPGLDYWNRVLTFVRNLPRLTTLQLRKWKRSVSVVPGLSPNLRKLDLSTNPVRGAGPPLHNDHILRLAELCPFLEDLTIETRRSRGDASEVLLYRALGRLTRLRRLQLTLDASPPRLINERDPRYTISSWRRITTSIEPWFDAWDAQYVVGGLRPHRKGHLRDVFVNSAVDSTLASSIFEVIDAAKAEVDEKVVPLERLEVEAKYGDAFPRNGTMDRSRDELYPYLAALERRWLVERDVRYDAGGRNVLHVREIGWKARQGEMERRVTYEYRNSHYLRIWRRIWPSEEDDAWWDAWESWPLAPR